MDFPLVLYSLIRIFVRKNEMKQEERWQRRYDEVKNFIETNKRNPSKYAPEERLMVNFLKRGRKMLNAGQLADPRFTQFLELLKLCNRYKRINQWKSLYNMFTLIQLPYAMEALEPVISAQTLSFHHGKHLQAYVDNLNKLLPGSEYEGMALEEIVRKAPAGPVFNNAGQILNHELYFTQFKPAGEAAQGPTGELAAQIEKQWGSVEAFKAEFEAKGVGLFGSGWVWLSADADGSLVITQEQGASNPVVKGLKPLLTFDVWEHAYYLDYQNRRAAHLSALWQIIDWNVIGARYGR